MIPFSVVLFIPILRSRISDRYICTGFSFFMSCDPHIQTGGTSMGSRCPLLWPMQPGRRPEQAATDGLRQQRQARLRRVIITPPATPASTMPARATTATLAPVLEISPLVAGFFSSLAIASARAFCAASTSA